MKEIKAEKVADAILERGRSDIVCETVRQEIKRLLAEQKRITTLIEGQLLKNIRIEELPILAGELTSIGLQIHFYSEQIALQERKK